MHWSSIRAPDKNDPNTDFSDVASGQRHATLTLGNTLTLYYVNATSLAETHAVQHLHSEISANHVHVALITESWFTARHLDADVAIDGYLLCRRDRFQRKGGGVCAHVDAHLSCELFHPCVNHSLVEILWLKVCSKTELYFLHVFITRLNPNMIRRFFRMS